MSASAYPRFVSLAIVVAVVAAVALVAAGATPRPAAAQPTSSGPLIGSPAALLDTLKSTNIQIQRMNQSSFFDVFTEIYPQANIGAGCDKLIVEVAAKGYKRNGKPLPPTCAGLRNTTLARDSFFDVFVSDGHNTADLVAASIETDVNPSTASRAFFDIFLDRQNPAASIVQATLTNNWSDQPEVVKAAKGSLKVNGENRFFVDVARVTSQPVAGGSPLFVLRWYHYWWYDSHNHYWWWYGPYRWWYYQYVWYGGTWWWWWNAWWPWWHGYHWYFWSNWWSDLNFIPGQVVQPLQP